MSISVDPHPLLDLVTLEVRFPKPLAALTGEDPYVALQGALPPWGDAEKELVRALLRAGGFKPSGRSKPCSEYMRAAAERGELPRVNAGVDVVNAAVLVGGLPISIVDAAKLQGALRVGVAEAGATYVFNRGGQEISLGGLLCLFDAEGPCANAVKDAQRTKTDDDTTEALILIWGSRAWPGRAAAVGETLQRALEGLGATPR
ncbi:hypothetical protein L6R49_26415 [Myxococcota bacterium]|nr:hypothetical protein [Myxococcota bacterium]